MELPLSNKKRIHLLIFGDVQGVGFRAWVRRLAQELGLTGWVRNREDGGVEVIAEGVRLEEFVKRCRKGLESSWVEKVDATWGEARGEFVDFEVVY